MHACIYIMHEGMQMLDMIVFCNLKVINEFSMIKNPKNKVSHAYLIRKGSACMQSCIYNACACTNA